MGLVTKILAAILILSFVVFCALFGSLPRLRKTPIGIINRLIWIKIPGLLFALDQALTGGKSTSFLKRSGHYLMHENHPLVLIFYLGVVFCAQVIFVPVAWPRINTFQRMIATVFCILPYFFTMACTFSTASTITPASHARHMRQYPYDHVLFHPGQRCESCQYLKPPRSKHCRICNVCVAKHDHHCIWVQNCLGRSNYIYFLAMLLSLGFMMLYGAYLSYGLLDTTLQSRHNQLHPEAALDPWSTGKTWSEWGQLWSWAFAKEIRIGCVGLLALTTWPLALGLLAYHLYLVWAGMTTNESFKWDEWKEDVADGYVYKREAQDEDDIVAVSEEYEPHVEWGASTRQRLVSRANKMSMQMELHPGMSLSQEPWVQVNGMEEMVNLYDLGFWDNMADVLQTSS